MPHSHVFISHSSKDDAFVKDLRQALEGHGVEVWADSGRLAGGAKLTPEVERAIEEARQFLAVLSPNAINSPWVRREIRKALEVESARKGEGYKVVPLLLPGVEPSALGLWFDEEPVGIKVEVTAGGLGEALPAILAALGERLPDDWQPPTSPAARPVAELKLRLKCPAFEMLSEGRRRATATAQLSYDPAEESRPTADSREFTFTAPLGPLEADDLRWYLESYSLWPTGVFVERARRVEAQLPEWGRELYEAATSAQSARELLADWERAGHPPRTGDGRGRLCGGGAGAAACLRELPLIPEGGRVRHHSRGATPHGCRRGHRGGGHLGAGAVPLPAFG